MFRVSKGTHGPVVNVNTVKQVEPAVGRAAPGHYHVDEITRDPVPCGHRSRRGGLATKRDDGSVMLERDPRP
jgi:hypothetical protein